MLDIEYLKVHWIHDFEDEPVLLYCEIGEDRYETRKVNIYKDRRFGLAYEDFEFGGTGLGEVPTPSVEEIGEDEQFDPYVITKEEFEDIWQEYTGYLNKKL